MRLLGGPHRSEGILELYYFGQWGGVCGQSFDVIAADAACVAFGYTRSRSFSFVSRYNTPYMNYVRALMITPLHELCPIFSGIV